MTKTNFLFVAVINIILGITLGFLITSRDIFVVMILSGAVIALSFIRAIIYGPIKFEK